jgi:ribosome biogenesis GTPase
VFGAIVKALSGFYYVRTGAEATGYQEPQAGRVYMCRARGVFKKEGVSPLVGDEVEFDILDDEDGFITDILPRRNSFARPAVANIDLLVATVAARNPKPNTGVLDRLLVTAEAASADAIVCVNKTDLGPADFIAGASGGRDSGSSDLYAGVYDALLVSAVTGEGIDELKSKLAGKRAAFAGPSGVGKSSLINCLLGCDDIETGGLSRKTGRGRHTTRHVEIFATDFGAELFDTPGYTSFEGVRAEPSELGGFFPEMAALSEGCRFDDCMHAEEPDCAVRAAAEGGGISHSRYASYLRMLDEAAGAK